MVNYRGPAAIRPIVEALEIPIFDRVRRLNYEVRTLSAIPLSTIDVAKLHDLEQISVTKRGVEQVDESDIKAASEFVPSCRLDNVETTKTRIDLFVKQGSQLACCSP